LCLGVSLFGSPGRIRTIDQPVNSRSAVERSSRERRAPALWRGGEVQLDRLAAGARARLDTSSPGPVSRISAAVFSAQLMQTPARSILQPVQLQLDL
jgi:hypothetical protein